MKRGSVRYLCQQTDSAAYGFERSKNKNSCRDFAAGEPDGAGIATRIAGSDRISSLIPASVTAAPWGSVLPCLLQPKPLQQALKSGLMLQYVKIRLSFEGRYRGTPALITVLK